MVCMQTSGALSRLLIAFSIKSTASPCMATKFQTSSLTTGLITSRSLSTQTTLDKNMAKDLMQHGQASQFIESSFNCHCYIRIRIKSLGIAAPISGPTLLPI
ncbi:hypothetical protein DE146DRAFT_152978 [Phaeosphaeria sp. MPI-PUGE-AT-0046c]|nr:hypothetical protein DE146DRAFT_152978 [Phaeosphaeria sp. MPI-PUGE-AT-0046c]